MARAVRTVSCPAGERARSISRRNDGSDFGAHLPSVKRIPPGKLFVNSHPEGRYAVAVTFSPKLERKILRLLSERSERRSMDHSEIKSGFL